MEQRRLGKSGIFVSNLCCGTMTFGTQNTEEEAFAILDRAYDAGIDFYDTAEIYPVPPDVKYVHRTEEILGKWLKTKPRDGLIIASKVVGPAQGWFTPPIREVHPKPPPRPRPRSRKPRRLPFRSPRRSRPTVHS